jgi:hypothetical protein
MLSCSDGSVGVAMGDGLDDRGSISGRGKLFLLSIASRPAIRQTQPPIQWALGNLSLRVKWPGREADHLSPSNAEVKNGGAIPPFRHVF